MDVMRLLKTLPMRLLAWSICCHNASLLVILSSQWKTWTQDVFLYLQFFSCFAHFLLIRPLSFNPILHFKSFFFQIIFCNQCKELGLIMQEEVRWEKPGGIYHYICPCISYQSKHWMLHHLYHFWFFLWIVAVSNRDYCS